MLSASILLMAMKRPTPALPASLNTRRVVTPMPLWALISMTTRIDGVDGADRLADEIGVAGRVDGVEPLAAVVEMDDVRLDAMVVDPLLLVEIADAGALVDACRAGDGAGHGEDFVQKGRFSGCAVTGECHVANVCD